MTTLSTVPVYPPPNRQINVVFSLAGVGSNYVRVWCSNAPPGSVLRTKLDGTSDPRNRVNVYEGDGGSDHPWRETFEVGGKYTLVAQEYTRGAEAFGGGYEDDPDGAPTETKVGAEATLSLYIGQRMSMPVGVGADTAELVLWVWDDTIRASSIALHGEVSPALVNASPSTKMRTAMESATVLAALDALAGVAVATAIGDIGTLVSDYLWSWNQHTPEVATIHAIPGDMHNHIQSGITATTPADLIIFVNLALPRMRYHFTNDGTLGMVDFGRNSVDVHEVGGNVKNDQLNMPLVQSVAGAGEAYIGLCDLYRCLAAHMLDTTVHTAADASEVLPSTSATKLLELHKAILAVLASSSPAVPATQSSGAAYLIQLVGAEEKPLES